jgi:hypothetical protein
MTKQREYGFPVTQGDQETNFTNLLEEQKKSSIEISPTSQNKTNSCHEGSGNKKSMFVTRVLIMDDEVCLKAAEVFFARRRRRRRRSWLEVLLFHENFIKT